MVNLEDLNWNDLKYFVVVARGGSLARAADILQVNHSTVFRRINSLEEALGTKLFQRLPDGYKLSEPGKEVLQYAEDISGIVTGIRSFLDNQNEEMQGLINLTAPHNLAYRFLPGYIQSFQQQYPEVSFNLLVTNSDCNLSKREADLAIRATPSPPEYLVGQKLFSLKWGVFGAESYFERFGRPESVDDLPSCRLISAHNDLGFLPAFKWIRENVPSGKVVAHSNDLVSMSALAEAGVGLAVLPDDQAKPSLERLFTFEQASTSDIWVLIHPDMRRCKRLVEFKNFVVNCFREDETFRDYQA